MKKKNKLQLEPTKYKKSIRITIPSSSPYKFLNHLMQRTVGIRVSTPLAPNIHSLTSRQQTDKLFIDPIAHPYRISTPQCQLHSFPTRSSLEKIVPENVIKGSLLKACKKAQEEYNTECIEKIIYNDKGHIVSLFKDYLVFDDIKELLVRFFTRKESHKRLRELIAKEKQHRPFQMHWEDYSLLAKAQEKKAKIVKLKNESNGNKQQHAGEEEEGSTFLRTAYMNSLAKEDLSNSLSRLPANSLECSNEEDCGKIIGLLSALNEKDVSAIRKSRLESASKPAATADRRKSQVEPSPVKRPGRESDLAAATPAAKKVQPPPSKTTAKLLTQLKGLTLGVHPMQKQPPQHANLLKKGDTLGTSNYRTQQQQISLTKPSVSVFGRTTIGGIKSPTMKPNAKKAVPFAKPATKYSVLTTKKLFMQAQAGIVSAKRPHPLEPSKTIHKPEHCMNTSRPNKASTSIGTYGGTKSMEFSNIPRLFTKPPVQTAKKVVPPRGDEDEKHVGPAVAVAIPAKKSALHIVMGVKAEFKKIEHSQQQQQPATRGGYVVPKVKPVTVNGKYCSKPPIRCVDLTNKLNI